MFCDYEDEIFGVVYTVTGEKVRLVYAPEFRTRFDDSGFCTMGYDKNDNLYAIYFKTYENWMDCENIEDCFDPEDYEVVPE